MDESKSRFVERMDKEFGGLSAKVGRLRVQVSLGKMEARDRCQSGLRILQSRLRGAQRRLGRIRRTSGVVWKELAAGLTATWKDLRATARTVSGHVRRPPRPRS